MPKLIVNGKDQEYLPENFPALLSNLISSLSLDNVSIVAEVDGSIVRKEKFSQTALNDGMKIELVKFVGGG